MSVKQIKLNQKNQKGGFHGKLLGIFIASFLGYMLSGKLVIQAGERTVRSSQDF